MARYRSHYRNLKIPIEKMYNTSIQGRVITNPGSKIEFEDFTYETEDENIINFLATDPVCVKMQENRIFAKIEDGIIEKATETLEEKEAKEEEEKAKAKEVKKKPTTKEKGTKKKVGTKKEEPQF